MIHERRKDRKKEMKRDLVSMKAEDFISGERGFLYN
jgi:hypothetical protein